MNGQLSDSPSDRRVRVGLALGAGAARGWSHIGVIEALAGYGIKPDVICGSSMGALVGAAYCAGRLDVLKTWATDFSRLDLARFVDVGNALSGVANVERLHRQLAELISDNDCVIESLNRRFGATATELHSGREIWFTEGPLMHSVHASIALPALLPPVRDQDRWLVDGGLVNPVPVSLCRALGAELIIAVNLNADLVGRHIGHHIGAGAGVEPDKPAGDGDSGNNNHSSWAFSLPGFGRNGSRKKAPDRPRMYEAVAAAMNIVQDRITRSRMAGDPPEITINPELAHVGLVEFYRAAHCIEEGRRSVGRVHSELVRLLGVDPLHGTTASSPSRGDGQKSDKFED